MWQVSIRPDPFGGFSDMIKDKRRLSVPLSFLKSTTSTLMLGRREVALVNLLITADYW